MITDMNIKQLLGAITAMIVKIAIAAVVIIVVFKLAVGAYDFGFQVFADIPVDEGDGRTVSVTISDGMEAKDVGELLVTKGLIENASVFYVQEMLSEYKDSICAGTYELNTAMSAEEMLEVICEAAEEGTEESN